MEANESIGTAIRSDNHIPHVRRYLVRTVFCCRKPGLDSLLAACLFIWAYRICLFTGTLIWLVTRKGAGCGGDESLEAEDDAVLFFRFFFPSPFPMVMIPTVLPRDKNDGRGWCSSVIVTAYSDLRIDVDVTKVVDRIVENSCPKELKDEVSLFIEKPEIDPWTWNALALVHQIDRMEIASDNITRRLRILYHRFAASISLGWELLMLQCIAFIANAT